MRTFLKSSLVAMLAMAVIASCKDDNTEPVEPTPEPTAPTLEVGEVTLSEDEKSATVEVTPSENAEELHWTCVEDGGAEYENGRIARGEKYTITLPNIKLDTDYKFTVWTANEVGESEKVVKDFRFNADEIMSELAEIQLINSTFATIDVKVVKSVKCSRYVVGAGKKYDIQYLDESGNTLPEPIKTERFLSTFEEQAKTSAAAYDEYAKGEAGDVWKMYAPFIVSTQTDSYGEYNLLLARNIMNRPGEYEGLKLEAGEEYVVAVYAYDAEGNGTLYSYDLTLPTTSPVKGTVDMSVTFKNVSTSYTKVEATITADAGCKRIFYGISDPASYGGSKNMEEMSNSEFEACLLTLNLGQSRLYTGPIDVTLRDNIAPGESRVVWAMGVDANGNIGKIERAFFHAPTYSAKGTGKIVTVDSMANSEDGKYLNISLTTSGAKSVRILAYPDVDWNQSQLRYKIDYYLYLPSEDGGGFYQEFPVKDDKCDIKIEFLKGNGRSNYYLYAAAVDANGALSYNKNLCSTYSSYSYSVWPIPSDVVEGWTFDGKGEVTVSIASEEFLTGSSFDPELSAKYKFSVAKGANTSAVYYIKLAGTGKDHVASKVETLIEALYDTPDDLPSASWYYQQFTSSETVTFGANNFTKFLNKYDATNGGDIAAFLTVDTDGKYKVAALCLPGGWNDDGTTTTSGQIVYSY